MVVRKHTQLPFVLDEVENFDFKSTYMSSVDFLLNFSKFNLFEISPFEKFTVDFSSSPGGGYGLQSA